MYAIDPRLQVTNPEKNEDGDFNIDPRLQTTRPVSTEEKAYLYRIWDGVEKSYEEAQEVGKKYKEGEISFLSGLYQTAGKYAEGLILNPLGETLIEAADGINWLTHPLSSELNAGVANGVNFLMNTSKGQEAQKAIAKGADAYKKWAEENPEFAGNVEATVNLGLAFMPVKAKADVGPVASSFGQLGYSSTLLEKAKAQKDKPFFNMIKPEKRTTLKNTEVQGFFGKAVDKPDAFQLRVIDQIKASGAKPVSLMNGYLKNYKHLEKEAEKLNAGLISILEKNPGQGINAQTLLDDITKSTDDIIANNPIVAGSPGIASNVTAQTKQLEILINKYAVNGVISPADVLKIRKEWDGILKNVETKVFNADYQSAKSITGTNVRNVLNKTVDQAVPQAGVKKQLEKQHLILSGMGMMENKALNESGRIVGRAWQNMSRFVQFKLDANRIMAILAGTSAFQAANMTIFSGAMLPSIGFGIVTYYVGRGVLSPQVKEALAYTVKELDRAILKTRNKSMRQSLMADRAAIYEMSQLPVEKENK